MEAGFVSADYMEALGAVLGGMGFLGVVLSFIFGAVLLFVLPIWAMVDCAVDENRDKGLKIVLVILLIVTWGLGSFFTAFS